MQIGEKYSDLDFYFLEIFRFTSGYCGDMFSVRVPSAIYNLT